MRPSFGDRHVLVVGSRGAIGESICNFFLNSGAIVIGCSRSKTTIDHKNFRHYLCDISEEDAVARLFYILDTEKMAPDIVILSAASWSSGMVALLSEREIETALSTDIKGTLLVTREAVKRMIRKDFGRIILLSSIRVSHPERGTGLYSMSKACLEHMIRVLPHEIGNAPLTFNAIEISLFDEGMGERVSSEARARLLASLAIRRVCTSQDLCNAIEFFARPESSYITGQVLKLGFV
jgi:3-oxoacyl-[acyl-carrier protein] reductase